jgi:hypothetical protein
MIPQDLVHIKTQKIICAQFYSSRLCKSTCDLHLQPHHDYHFSKGIKPCIVIPSFEKATGSKTNQNDIPRPRRLSQQAWHRHNITLQDRRSHRPGEPATHLCHSPRHRFPTQRYGRAPQILGCASGKAELAAGGHHTERHRRYLLHEGTGHGSLFAERSSCGEGLGWVVGRGDFGCESLCGS